MFSDLSGRSDSDLRAMQINVAAWRHTCRSLFLLRTRRFTHVKYASRQDYPKHRPPPGSARAARWIEEQSQKQGVSLFYLNIPDDHMLTAFLHGIFDTFPAVKICLAYLPRSRRFVTK